MSEKNPTTQPLNALAKDGTGTVTVPVLDRDLQIRAMVLVPGLGFIFVAEVAA
jgi:hypothetical protein